MKILLVSDTHGNDRRLEEAVLKEFPFDFLIHCGDVEGSAEYIEEICDVPTLIVAGNMDYYGDLPKEEVLKLQGHRILVTHGHLYGVSTYLGELYSAAKRRHCEAVFFGHTHQPLVDEQDGILAVNPGSLTHPRQPGRKPSYMVIEALIDQPLEIETKYLT